MNDVGVDLTDRQSVVTNAVRILDKLRSTDPSDRVMPPSVRLLMFGTRRSERPERRGVADAVLPLGGF
jgi:hypothetical protein